MEKIDWNHWFRHRTLNDWEVVALSLGINPMDIDVNSIGGINYIFDEIIPKHRVEYESRVRLLQDFRFKPYSYFEGDDEAGNYFDASDSKFKKVLVKRFLLWLKYEDMGLTLPPEMTKFIGGLLALESLKTKPKGRPKSLSKDKEKELIKTNNQNPNLSQDALADIFNVSRSTVGNTLRKIGKK